MYICSCTPLMYTFVQHGGWGREGGGGISDCLGGLVTVLWATQMQLHECSVLYSLFELGIFN